MRYTEDQFYALMDEVEAQGGEHLSGERCEDRTYDLMGDCLGPHLRRKTSRKAGTPDRGGAVVTELAGCGNNTLFLVPYGTPEDPRPQKVCAVCDDLGYWPRFSDAVGSI